MYSTDTGTLPGSNYFFQTPSEDAQKLFYYTVSCGHYHTVNGYGMRRSYYEHLLFLHVCSGSINLEYLGKSYTVKAGYFFVIDCRHSHFYYTPEACEFIWIHFDGLNSHELVNYINQQYGVVFDSNFYQEQVKALENLLYCYREDQPVGEAECGLIISQLLYGTMCRRREDVSLGIQSEAVRISIRYIQAHMSEPIRVEDLAAQAFLSPYHFSRLFRKETGRSPYQYLIQARINRAKYLLKTTELPLEDIASAVGYRSEGRFINAFTQVVGISPGKFRRYPI